MDLFLMDAILKGHVPERGSVLDLGCGEGRNAFYFIRTGYTYLGIDSDASQIQLINYISKNLEKANASFVTSDIQGLDLSREFDIVICSRVLHFAEDVSDFFAMWQTVDKHLKQGGVAYVALDSMVETTLASKLDRGWVEFPDGKSRFALTESIYQKMKEGFEEIEPLKTISYHRERAQSFLLLRKR